MRTSVRIDEILRVIYTLVHKALQRQTVICTPAVGHYFVARPYPLFNQRKKRGWIPRRHRYKKRPTRAAFETAENPKTVYPPPPIVFSVPNFCFVNFYNHSLPTQNLWPLLYPKLANLTTKWTPIDDAFFTNGQFPGDESSSGMRKDQPEWTKATYNSLRKTLPIEPWMNPLPCSLRTNVF